MLSQEKHILFVCVGNAGRSIMAEAVLNHFGKDRYCAYSAGTRPGGLIHPFALEQIRTLGYPVEQLRNKGIEEFAKPNARKMDFVITVCDQVEHEKLPIWPGNPICAHWPFEPPYATKGAIEARRRIFRKLFSDVQARIQAFLAIPIDTLDRASLQQKLRTIRLIQAE
jgi:arsenate reductase